MRMRSWAIVSRVPAGGLELRESGRPLVLDVAEPVELREVMLVRALPRLRVRLAPEPRGSRASSDRDRAAPGRWPKRRGAGAVRAIPPRGRRRRRPSRSGSPARTARAFLHGSSGRKARPWRAGNSCRARAALDREALDTGFDRDAACPPSRSSMSGFHRSMRVWMPNCDRPVDERFEQGFCGRKSRR